MTISIRFNSSYTHSKSFPTKFRDNRCWVVVFKAIYCLYETCRRLLIDVNSRGTYQQTTHCPWTVTNPPRISHLQMSKWQVTTMFPRSNLIYRRPPISNVPRNLMHGIDNRLHNCMALTIVYIIDSSRVTCKLGRLRWTTNSHGGKHFGWQTDCGSEIAHCYVEM